MKKKKKPTLSRQTIRSDVAGAFLPALTNGPEQNSTPLAGAGPIASTGSIIRPFYYVKHPDGSFTEANPQP